MNAQNRTVTDLGPYSSYRARWGLFRTTIAALMHARGLPAVVTPERRRLSDAMREGELLAHITVPGWAVMVSTSWDRSDLSGWSDRASVAALHDGENLRSAVVWARPGRTVAESYVFLPLATFLDVLSDEAARSDA